MIAHLFVFGFILLLTWGMSSFDTKNGTKRYQSSPNNHFGVVYSIGWCYNRCRLHPRRYALRQSIGALKEMTQRTFTGKTGDVWTWEETPEVVAALKQLHNTSVNNRVNRPHNYEGPLYAPHPDLKKDA